MLKYKRGCGCGDDGSCASCGSCGTYATGSEKLLLLDGGCNGCKLKFRKLFNRQCNCGRYDCPYCNQGQERQCNCGRYDCPYCNQGKRKMKILIIKSDGKKKRKSKKRSKSLRKRTLKTLRRSRRLK